MWAAMGNCDCEIAKRHQKDLPQLTLCMCCTNNSLSHNQVKWNMRGIINKCSTSVQWQISSHVGKLILLKRIVSGDWAKTLTTKRQILSRLSSRIPRIWLLPGWLSPTFLTSFFSDKGFDIHLLGHKPDYIMYNVFVTNTSILGSRKNVLQHV